MREYSFTEARQNFASILEQAKKEGGVCVKKRDGEAFVIKVMKTKRSPLDVAGVELGATAAEIVETIREGRQRGV